MSRGGRAALAALVLAASVGGAFPAKPNRRTVPLADLPAWAREAAATPTPATDAAAVVLHDETIAQPIAEGGVKLTRRYAIRPLKRAAIADAEIFAVPYRRDDTKPEVRGWTVSPDGRTAVAPDPVLDRRDDPWTDGGSVADDSRILHLAAANPVVGATFVSESSVIRTLDLGAVVHHFGHERYPVRRSRLSLQAPKDWGVDWSASGTREVPCAVEGSTVTCDASDLPPLPTEEGTPPAADLIARVWARWWSPDGRRGFADWEALGRWYESLTSPVLADLGEVTRLAQAWHPKSPEELGPAIERAFDYVSTDVRYVSIQLGIGGYKPHPPSLVLSRKFGDCKDKAFLLRAIVGHWGLRTFPVVVKTRSSGEVDPDVPAANQFNHAIAAILLPEGALVDRWPVLDVEGVGRVLFLDGTARGWSAWTLPDGDQGTRALLVLPEGGRLIELPVQPPEASTVERTLDAELDEAGTLRSAVLEERLLDAEGAELRAGWSAVAENERRRLYEAWLQSRFPGSVLGSYTVEGLERSGSPVVQRSTLQGGWFGKRVGGMLIVSPGKTAGGLYPRKLPSSLRWDLRVLPRQERVESAVLVPDGFVPEELPRPIEVSAGGVEGRADWTFERGRLRYRRLARLTAHRVEAEGYAAFRDAVRRLDAADATAVVFVKAAP